MKDYKPGRSRSTSGSGYVGTIPHGVWEVLEHAWEDPFTLSSNFAREHTVNTAFAASMGWISTIAPDGRTYSNRWRITLEGIVAWQAERQRN